MLFFYLMEEGEEKERKKKRKKSPWGKRFPWVVPALLAVPWIAAVRCN
jgi:hypothetical protein